LTAGNNEKITLSEMFLKRSTMPDMKAADAQGVIRELVEPLAAAGIIKPGKKKKLVQDLLEREKQGSTGIGGGAAVPHAACKGLDRVYGILGRSAAGVDFKCITGEHTHIFFLVLYPPEMQHERRLILGRILELSRTGNFVKFLRAAENAREMNDLLGEVDNED